ncbi:MAG: pyruvate, phosphate dikinase, partial [Planctomycetes bacterium]|nr:pyruvate, phosphate dikinase [Planctomycetota bacterium]
MSQPVYFFAKDKTEGNASMKELLGGKGANLAEMTRLGIPVPPGFTLSTEQCAAFIANHNRLPAGLWEEVERYLGRLEEEMGQRFGAPERPLLLSVRSGAADSMPGMMDTILNLGLNDESVQGLVEAAGTERFAWDAYRRLVNMFGNVVMGVEHAEFEAEMQALKEETGKTADTELTTAELRDLTQRYRAVFEQKTGKAFPQAPREQLRMAVEAVFRSWSNPRAVKYRALNRITGLLGTAVNVQAMVFGNMGDTSGTGVCFTRNPATGEKVFYGEYLINAQGEDVVAGIRTPEPIATLEAVLPDSYRELCRHQETLERHYRDMQDIEFTIQEGKLYILQTRRGKRTPVAAVRCAVEMVKEELIDERTAVTRVRPEDLDVLLHPSFDPAAPRTVIARGLPASPGAASGHVYFTARDVEARAARGERVLLVRRETSPEDVGGMHAAQGILTAVGGMTSHAAIVARGMGKCCIVGCAQIQIAPDHRSFRTEDGTAVREGDLLSLDGTSGEVYRGEVATIPPEISGDFEDLLKFADAIRTLKVRTNCDTPGDAVKARELGAEGIGLTRTEHMFFEKERIWAMREMILAENTPDREKALAKLLPMQRGDFEGIFRAMDGLPVTIRLLDPPLHEFLPEDARAQEEMAQRLAVSVEAVAAKVAALRELNPMLGHRGCRLGITFPEIYRMQVRAILEAACNVAEQGVDVHPEIMIPLVGVVTEFDCLARNVMEVYETIRQERGRPLRFLVGTMIEVPRAALTAGEVARRAQFFSFGTNDLTQMTFGLSRDDVGSFLPYYIDKGLLETDPFASLDTIGVGRLVALAVDEGRRARPDLKVGICGEHGGDPASI